jgi:hypothetical protein
MPKDTDARHPLSRRNLFKRFGLAGAAAAVSPLPVAASGTAPTSSAGSAPLPTGEALETLTAAEADLLEAIVARLIPADENGPGATEARAAHFIDRALAGPLAASRSAYALGLAAVDGYAQAYRGAPFGELSAPDQDAVLADIEKNIATGLGSPSAEVGRGTGAPRGRARWRRCGGLFARRRRGDHEDALTEAEQALTISPNLAAAHAVRGATLIFSGRPKEGVTALETSSG